MFHSFRIPPQTLCSDLWSKATGGRGGGGGGASDSTGESTRETRNPQKLVDIGLA
jgi:hypothetical protein